MSADQKHTPGPWRADSRDSGEHMRPRIRILRDVHYVPGAAPTTYVIAETVYPTTAQGTVGADERKANARLIAAAPELLETVRNLLEQIDATDVAIRGFGFSVQDTEAMRFARALIARIEGGAA